MHQNAPNSPSPTTPRTTPTTPAPADDHQYQSLSGCLWMAVIGIIAIAMAIGAMVMAGRLA